MLFQSPFGLSARVYLYALHIGDALMVESAVALYDCHPLTRCGETAACLLIIPACADIMQTIDIQSVASVHAPERNPYPTVKPSCKIISDAAIHIIEIGVGEYIAYS